eukprot:COSAG04_NODE_1566_length_6320_cov_15.884102_2_plen_111_part_00
MLLSRLDACAKSTSGMLCQKRTSSSLPPAGRASSASRSSPRHGRSSTISSSRARHSAQVAASAKRKTEPPTLLSHRYFSAVSPPNFAHFTPFFARSLRLGARKPETAKER